MASFVEWDGALWRYRAQVDYLIDADTIVAEVDLGFDVQTNVHLRLAGVDAPEMKTDAGLQASDALGALLRQHRAWDWQSLRVQSLRRANGNGVRSFERWVARVWLVPEVGEELIDLAAWLVDNGHAVWAKG